MRRFVVASWADRSQRRTTLLSQRQVRSRGDSVGLRRCKRACVAKRGANGAFASRAVERFAPSSRCRSSKSNARMRHERDMAAPAHAPMFSPVPMRSDAMMIAAAPTPRYFVSETSTTAAGSCERPSHKSKAPYKSKASPQRRPPPLRQGGFEPRRTAGAGKRRADPRPGARQKERAAEAALAGTAPTPPAQFAASPCGAFAAALAGACCASSDSRSRLRIDSRWV